MERTQTKYTDEALDEIIVALKLWNEYTEELDGRSKDENLTLQAFCKIYNVPDQSKLALMFHAFCGGIAKGLELAERITNGTE